eukprot:TRINITY_DN35809_c0_g1_i2.p1 TRINITY_DN35809_c0_g1~~TRINITY_DN35809_c0_g1_i2.p1  ORF type:complete len:883 (-),score=180.16 TRINITY_DN35809_c0_g1_i2:1303-3885(-)
MSGIASAVLADSQQSPSLVGQAGPARWVFVMEKMAGALLAKVVPSGRYGGAAKLHKKAALSLMPQESLESRFRAAMRPGSMLHGAAEQAKQIACSRLVSKMDKKVCAKLAGPVWRRQQLFEAVGRCQAEFFEAHPDARQADTDRPYPIFLCSKGRSATSFLEWRAPHCFGNEVGSNAVVLVIVVEPQEEESYRSVWPDALLLVLPQPNDTCIGYTRWVVQMVCTSSVEEETGRLFRLPFVWMADDLIVSFYHLESLGHCGSGRRRVLRALDEQGFREAFLAIQRHESICEVAMAGFLRERGSSIFAKRDWVMNESLALQKIVLLNLVRLQDLGAYYCPALRKSEDLAICYEVARQPSGNILKCQRYCYRASHLDHGGAEEVRRESMRNFAAGHATADELLRGGDAALRSLTDGNRSSATAILQWLRNAQARNRALGAAACKDGNGDFLDGVELASEVLLEALKDVPKVSSSGPSGIKRLQRSSSGTSIESGQWISAKQHDGRGSVYAEGGESQASAASTSSASAAVRSHVPSAASSSGVHGLVALGRSMRSESGSSLEVSDSRGKPLLAPRSSGAARFQGRRGVSSQQLGSADRPATLPEQLKVVLGAGSLLTVPEKVKATMTCWNFLEESWKRTGSAVEATSAVVECMRGLTEDCLGARGVMLRAMRRAAEHLPGYKDGFVRAGGLDVVHTWLQQALDDIRIAAELSHASAFSGSCMSERENITDGLKLLKHLPVTSEKLQEVAAWTTLHEIASAVPDAQAEVANVEAAWKAQLAVRSAPPLDFSAAAAVEDAAISAPATPVSTPKRPRMNTSPAKETPVGAAPGSQPAATASSRRDWNAHMAKWKRQQHKRSHRPSLQ